MNEQKEMEGDSEKQPVPVERTTNTRGLVEVQRIHQKGGYFVGGVGWSGYAFYMTSKILSFLVSGILWALIAILWIMFDETVRMEVRNFLDVAGEERRVEREDFKFAVQESSDYQHISTKWKQLLAEVQLNNTAYNPRFIRILNDLTLGDIEKIDRFAPHVIEGAILRNGENNSNHDIIGLSFLDFARLKTIGILQQGQLGQQIKVSPQNGQSASQVLRGTTLALEVIGSERSVELSIPVTLLTEEGTLIIRLLDRATSLAGVCTGASRFDPAKYTTRIWARFGSSKKPWSDQAEVREVTSLCGSK